MLLVGQQERHRDGKNWVVGCWRGYLSVCNVQTCRWPSWCHCHSLSLASVKSRLVLPFWYWLTRLVPEKGLLNVCACVRVCFKCLSFRFFGSACCQWTENHVCVFCLCNKQPQVWLANNWDNGSVSWQTDTDLSPLQWSWAQGSCLSKSVWQCFSDCWWQLSCRYIGVSAFYSTSLFWLQTWPSTSWPSHMFQGYCCGWLLIQLCQNDQYN